MKWREGVSVTGRHCLLLLFHQWMPTRESRPLDLNYWIKLRRQQLQRTLHIHGHDPEMRIEAPRGRIAMGNLMMTCWCLSV